MNGIFWHFSAGDDVVMTTHGFSLSTCMYVSLWPLRFLRHHPLLLLLLLLSPGDDRATNVFLDAKLFDAAVRLADKSRMKRAS